MSLREARLADMSTRAWQRDQKTESERGARLADLGTRAWQRINQDTESEREATTAAAKEPN